MSTSLTSFTVVTANLAGAAREEKSHPHKLRLLGSELAKTEPDLLGLQEVIRVYDPEGCLVRDDLETLQGEGELSAYSGHFFPHLDSTQQSHDGKWTETFPDYYRSGYRIQQGSAMLVHELHPLCDLLADDRRGFVAGQIIPWTSSFYLGNRDTEPRSLLLARLRLEGRRSILFACTHLTALKEENIQGNRTPSERGVEIRRRQIAWLVEYLSSYRDERRRLREVRGQSAEEEPLILVGDFNALPEELKDSRLAELGIEEVEPEVGLAFTHRKYSIRIDLIYASKSFTRRSCRILDLGALETVQGCRVSDHHPVIAELAI